MAIADVLCRTAGLVGQIEARWGAGAGGGDVKL